MSQLTPESIVLKLLGHDDSVDFGNGYHDECKEEFEEAVADINRLITEARIDEQKRTMIKKYDDGVKLLMVLHPTEQYITQGVRINELQASLKTEQESK